MFKRFIDDLKRIFIEPLFNERGEVGNDDDDDKGGEGNYLGDWKTREDAEKGFKSFQEMHGKQTNELGTLRKEVGTLTDQLSEMTNLVSEMKSKANTTDTGKATAGNELEAVFQEYGNLDFFNDDSAGKKGAELLKKAVLLTAKTVQDETMKAAGTQLNQTLAERDAQKLKENFLKDNPDFEELKKTGAFKDFKKKNPLHDDFSAYYEFKAAQLNGKVSELESLLAEAKKVANLAGGDTKTGKIFTKGGNRLPPGNQKMKTGADRLNSALEAMRKAGGQT